MFDQTLWLHVWNLWLIPQSSQMNPLNCALLLVLAGFSNNFTLALLLPLMLSLSRPPTHTFTDTYAHVHAHTHTHTRTHSNSHSFVHQACLCSQSLNQSVLLKTVGLLKNFQLVFYLTVKIRLIISFVRSLKGTATNCIVWSIHFWKTS